MKNNKSAMSRMEMVLFIGYLLLGWFLLFAAEYHVGCRPGRSAGDVAMCSGYCYLGINLDDYRMHDSHVMRQAAPIMPCNPWE